VVALSSPSFAAAISSCFCAILNGFSSSTIAHTPSDNRPGWEEQHRSLS
jgi:hypothetical protein